MERPFTVDMLHAVLSNIKLDRLGTPPPYIQISLRDVRAMINEETRADIRDLVETVAGFPGNIVIVITPERASLLVDKKDRLISFR